MLKINVNEGSLQNYVNDKGADSIRFRNQSDNFNSNTIQAVKDWFKFRDLVKNRGKKYGILSQLDPEYKRLLDNRKQDDDKTISDRLAYLDKNGFYVTEFVTYVDINGVKSQCMVRFNDHIQAYRTSENKNQNIHCFVNFILDEKERVVKNRPSRNNVISIYCRISTDNEEEVDNLVMLRNEMYNNGKRTISYNELLQLFKRVSIDASINGAIYQNISVSEAQTVLKQEVERDEKENQLKQQEVENERLLKQQRKEELKASKVTNIYYAEIKEKTKEEIIGKTKYDVFEYNGVKYASNDGLKTAYRIKSKGGVSKSENDKVNIIRVNAMDNYKDVIKIDGKDYYLFVYDQKEWVTPDLITAYELVNGKITNQTLPIKEMKQRKRNIIKLTESQFRLVEKLYLMF
jgi:hypothetical protein